MKSLLTTLGVDIDFFVWADDSCVAVIEEAPDGVVHVLVVPLEGEGGIAHALVIGDQLATAIRGLDRTDVRSEVEARLEPVPHVRVRPGLGGNPPPILRRTQPDEVHDLLFEARLVLRDAMVSQHTLARSDAAIAWAGEVRVDYGQFYLKRVGASDFPDAGPGEPDRIWSNGSEIYVAATTPSGPVPIEVEFHDRSPTETLPVWQHVVDVSLDRGGALCVLDWGGDERDARAILPIDPDPVRLRMHWGGLSRDGETFSAERLALAVWPAPVAPTRVIRRWSGWRPIERSAPAWP